MLVRLYEQHNNHYVIFNRCSEWRLNFLYNQSHIFHTALVFSTSGNDINSRGVDIGVTENVCQLCNIFFNTIKSPCK